MKLSVLILLLLASCTTMRDASFGYFMKHNKAVGVMSFPLELERLEEKNIELKKLIYGPMASAKLTTCVMLRNQLYVAVLDGVSGADGKQIKEATQIMEEAYQTSDEEFLAACDQILATPVGAVFVEAQQYYVISR